MYSVMYTSWFTFIPKIRLVIFQYNFLPFWPDQHNLQCGRQDNSATFKHLWNSSSIRRFFSKAEINSGGFFYQGKRSSTLVALRPSRVKHFSGAIGQYTLDHAVFCLKKNILFLRLFGCSLFNLLLFQPYNNDVVILMFVAIGPHWSGCQLCFELLKENECRWTGKAPGQLFKR